jgi:hypothetical protein
MVSVKKFFTVPKYGGPELIKTALNYKIYVF